MLVSALGALLTIMLVVAGVLLLWAYTFTNNQVTSQLSEQKIIFPAKGTPALTALPATDRAAMEQYAGQMMTDGAQANTYANHFISVHLNQVAGGKTYSEVSAAALANPANAKLADQANTLFKGTMLRSSLLTAYAFWQIGQIALIAGIVALCAAFIMLILTLLGLSHLSRTAPEAELRA